MEQDYKDLKKRLHDKLGPNLVKVIKNEDSPDEKALLDALRKRVK